MPNTFTPLFTLVDMNLEAVALCSQGANSRANILLTKSMKEGNSKMGINEILAGLSEEAQATLTKHIEETATANVTKAVEDAVAPLNAKIAELEATNKSLEENAAKATQPAEPEDFTKSLPEPARKQFEEMQKSLAALQAERAEALAKSRFEVVKAIPCDSDKLKSILKNVDADVFEVLTKAAAAIEEGIGKSTAAVGEGKLDKSTDDYYKELETIADGISKSEGVSLAKAFTLACERNADLYAKYAGSQS
jgi:hypothetical protein